MPDLRHHLLGQDVALVEGGSVVNLVAVWRAHGLPEVLRACWEAGVVLTGTSAGSLCWFVGGPTDSFGDDRVFRDLVAGGALPGGYATEDGVGLHFRGTELAEAVTIRPGARAWAVNAAAGGSARSTPIAARVIP